MARSDVLSQRMYILGNIFPPGIRGRIIDRATPHAPTWGYENRTTAVRIPGGSRRAIRLEHRVCGADTNPYLAVAGILAGALMGIEQRLLPPAPVVGDAYSQFERSAFVGEYLGEEVRRIFLMSKWQELEEFMCHVPTMEYDAYLDL